MYNARPCLDFTYVVTSVMSFSSPNELLHRESRCGNRGVEAAGQGKQQGGVGGGKGRGDQRGGMFWALETRAGTCSGRWLRFPQGELCNCLAIF